jgi:hypothetical protein
MDPELLRAPGWRLRHPLEERHGNVYGANLGVRASAYRQATDSTRVLTFGRTVARAPHGFSAYLRALGVETAAALRST